MGRLKRPPLVEFGDGGCDWRLAKLQAKEHSDFPAEALQRHSALAGNSTESSTDAALALAYAT